jgi:hypothetical protein
MILRRTGRASINDLKHEIHTVVETGRADLTVIREAKEILDELRNLLDKGDNIPEEVIMEAPVSDAVRFILYSALEDVTED